MLSGVNLATTVVGFGMSAIVVILICLRLICCSLRSDNTRSANTRSATPFPMEFVSAGEDQLENRIGGLEPVLIALIPTMEYKHEDFSAREDSQCSICLDEYKEKEMLRILPSCHHNFHLECIDLWLQQQSTCPICRLPLHELLEAKYTAAALLGIQMVGSTACTSRQYSQWLLAGGQWPGLMQNNHRSFGSASPTVGHPHREIQEISHS